jgi:hypothetical protein
MKSPSNNSKVAMMQPTFLPWQGFFELIYQSERFLVLDDFQFSVQSYHQRNRLFVSNGQVDWYSVPVRKSLSFGAPLNQTLINDAVPWRIKMWKRIQQNYSKTSFFKSIAAYVEKWLFRPSPSLAVQNIGFISLACDLLGLERQFIRSSELSSDRHRSERVAELLETSGAGTYYCAKGAFEYMLADGVFPLDDVEVLFQDFQPEPYPQTGSPGQFVPYLSILDALFNIGPEVTLELVMRGTSRWLTWNEMIAKSEGT